jgi:hypothetical protein
MKYDLKYSENGRQPKNVFNGWLTQFFGKWKKTSNKKINPKQSTSIFVETVEYKHFSPFCIWLAFNNIELSWSDSKPKTIKSKHNGCGTAPGDLVF